MESESKRRKLDHSGHGLRHKGLIDFESRDATRLSAASTFVLKTDELLKETKLVYSVAFKGLDGQLHKIKSIIDSIEPHDPAPIYEASTKFEKKHRITIPYPEPKPTKESNYKVAFSPPAQCNVVGSFVGKTMTKLQERLGIDMVVQMPKTLFQDKDYLYLRYFYRRAYYIAYIASKLKSDLGEQVDIHYELLHENPLLPILVLRLPEQEASKPSKKPAKHDTHIRLIPCAPDDLFPWSKLTPNSTNIRTETTEASKKTVTSTPFYNSTLNAERTFIQYLRVVTNAKNECAAFGEACILGRIWLQQRGFGSAISRGGFGHFEWAAMIALLLKMGGRNGAAALSTSLSATELFKAAIQFLSTTDFTKKAFAFNSAKAAADSMKETGPVMFDPTRQLNLLFKMTPGSANYLHMCAKSTTELLADEASDKFDATFITKVDVPSQVFDAVMEIRNPNLSKYAASPDRRSEIADFGLDASRILHKAFGKRAQLVCVQPPSRKQWKLAGTCPPAPAAVTVGVIFDLVHMSRQMEHGPSAEEQKEAARFRQFWGEKAELRRFKDGSILECVEWTSKLPLHICQEIAQYALNRHLKLAQENVQLVSQDLAGVIDMSHLDKSAFDAARRSFQTFEHDIRTLEDLPLQIRQLSPVSALARYASVEAPPVGFHKDTIEPIDVNLYFEQSSKWPENLTAIQEAKIEFLLDIDRRLTGAHENIKTYLGRENRDIGIANLAFLDVLYDSGAAFRLRIHCDLEETLLERQAKNKVLDPHARDEAKQASLRFHWLFDVLPLHTQTIATYCTRLPALSPTIRLVKRWFAAHKLAGHVREELVELLALHAFLQPYPWATPSSATTGFLRTLALLARWDWRERPLVLDTAEEMTPADRAAVQATLDGWRRRDPAINTTPVLVVATAFAPSGAAYTQDHGPGKLVAARMTRLAKAACKLLRGGSARLDVEALFEPALHDFDVLIRLSAKALRVVARETGCDAVAPRASQFRNLDGVAGGRAPLPVRARPVDVLVEELRRVYADTLVFFPGGDDGDDGATIAALWDPRSLRRSKFRAGLPYNFCSVPGEDGDGEGEEDVVGVNRKAVLLEIARIGGALIKSIEMVAGDDDEE
ncbi:pre-rRNA processing protein Utp22 [Cordyceps fumosorosea ARSEF 2679]|uniref:U3 small nucleolar RNA-associated protein 22 n=1 Tax=Cordyceps fumosorosea (strain ARSEF 2679) TaxID=1081104 RepID=A0A168ECG6_CORFA|nr:pre-rRNA processing protein Utp22 [Cordyceps fumosorosea ARSEF 2679]OAA73646.1 pre-rRNA processing protein Utp22 [Cordyceps fumosorosea ARSEF 2679]